MMNLLKKTVAVILALALVFSFVGCGANDVDENTASDSMRTFTDSLGRSIEIPDNVETVAVSGPLAQLVIYALCPEKLVGLAVDWEDAALPYVPDEYLNLPVLGQLYGGKGDLNPESLLQADPDFVIDIGEAKEGITEDLDSLGEQTGIPFIHISLNLQNTPEALRMLGDLLGIQETAEEYAAYCERIYSMTEEVALKAEKKDILYVTGEEGLNVIAKGSYHSEILDMFTNNLAVVESPSPKGTGNEVDMEQILSWNPDYIIFNSGSIYDKVLEMEEWQGITAVSEKNIYEAPNGPYNWMGFPPSVQRYLGMMWLSYTLYPELCDFNLYDEVHEYYQMFYHWDLTEEQYRSLMGE